MYSLFSSVKITLSIFLFALVGISTSVAQTLVINELSNGSTGAEEYVELLVVGTPDCSGIPTLDMRGFYLDDNNGTFASGGGTGIASGCMRFKNVAFWQAIPVGTLIVIYNDADVNASIPAQDVSMSDGNCRLIIRANNCTLFETNSSSPSSTGSSTYPTTGFSTCDGWATTVLGNSGDSYQVRNASGVLLHAVSYGNNSSNSIIYFAGAGGGMVYRMMNGTDNNPSLQANWTQATTAGNESPGSPNNAANATWIHSMNNSCSPITPISLSTSFTNAGCICNGTATVVASGGIGPYTYSWTGTIQTTATVTSLCSGSYTVTVTDNRGCTEITSVTIGAPTAMVSSVTTTSVSCNGGNNGSASATVTGGTAPYTYAWSTGGSGSSISNLIAGNYSLNVTDNSGCTSTSAFTINEPTALNATSTTTDAKCFGSSDGTASLTTSGGTGSYTYSWSPSGGSASFNNTLSAGNYTVQIADGNNCGVSRNFTIAQPSQITSTTSFTNETCTLQNGSASISVSGGTPGYTYLWSNGVTVSTANALNAGTYTINVTDLNLCLHTAQVTVSNISGPAITMSHSDITCNGLTDGSASATISGGSAPFVYSWSNGGNGTSITNLSAGNYSLNVTDNNSCVSTSSFTIVEPSAINSTSTTSNAKCFGASDGTASLSTTGGTGAYTYSWSPSGGNASFNNTLAAGNYTVQIKDANNCEISSSFIISQPNALSATTSITNETCSLQNGTADVNVSGGTPAYTYLWSNGANLSTANLLSAGTYTINVTDLNLCVYTAEVIVNNISGPSVSLNHTDITCNGLANGTAQAIVTGGTSGYTYNWMPGGMTTSSVSNLSAGTYTTTVTDGAGCIVSESFSITEPSSITISLNTGTICIGQTFDLTAVISGGQQPYTNNWNSGASSANVYSVGPSSTSTFSLSVTDNAGCVSSIATTTVTVRNAITIDPILNDTICTGNSSTLAAIAHGGDGSYIYTWMPGNLSGASVQVTPSATTNYTVTVSDGCTVVDATQTANIILFAFPPVTFVTDTLTACLPICINFFNTTIIPSSNISSVSWNFGDHASSNLLQPIHCYTTAGNYQPTLTISSNDGCIVTGIAPFTISIIEQPKAIISSSANEVSFDEATVEITSNSLYATSIEWLNYNGQTFSTETITLNYESEGSFPISLVATNSLGCRDTATEIITVKPGFTFYIPNSFTPDGDKFNKTFSALGMGWNEKDYLFEIYNRWGEKVFSTTNINDTWDGTYKGKPAQIDIYVWKIVVFDAYMNEHSHSGKVSLIR